MTESDCSSLAIPDILIGTYKEVLPKCRKMIRRALKLRDWDAATAELRFVPLDDVPGDLVLRGPSPFNSGGNVHLFVVGREFDKLVPKEDRDQWFVTVRDLTLAGLDRFWFALTVLAEDAGLPMKTSHDVELPIVQCRYLAKLLRWWPQFCDLEGRFVEGTGEPARWPDWALGPRALCNRSGMPSDQLEELHTMDPMEAAAAMQLWVMAHGVPVRR